MFKENLLEYIFDADVLLIGTSLCNNCMGSIDEKVGLFASR